jgi:hypothetical protein
MAASILRLNFAPWPFICDYLQSSGCCQAVNVSAFKRRDVSAEEVAISVCQGQEASLVLPPQHPAELFQRELSIVVRADPTFQPRHTFVDLRSPHMPSPRAAKVAPEAPVSRDRASNVQG